MENSYVFQTSQAKTALAAALLIAFALSVPAGATTLIPSQTIHAGAKIKCVLDSPVNSATAKYGDKFRLRVVDPSYPALEGAEVHGWLTEVEQPSGMNRAKIAFLLTTIHLRNGTKKPISAYVVNKGVVQYNPKAQEAVRQPMMAPMPNGFTTPGPIAWQMRAPLGGGGVSVSNRATGSLGGYIYASNPHEAIVIPSGTGVTIELQQSLTIP
jgi:hypothetical protein